MRRTMLAPTMLVPTTLVPTTPVPTAPAATEATKPQPVKTEKGAYAPFTYFGGFLDQIFIALGFAGAFFAVQLDFRAIFIAGIVLEIEDRYIIVDHHF